MGNKLKNIGLVGIGMVAGVAASVQFSAMAQKGAPAAQSPLPLDELRQLADVYGLIKSDYVEPVEDKKLLSDAIAGMVASLDPHSVYLDEKDFAEMREGCRASSSASASRVAMEDGYVKIVSPIEDTPAFRAGIKAGDLITRIDNVPVKGLSAGRSHQAHARRAAQQGAADHRPPRRRCALGGAGRAPGNPHASVKAKMVEPGYAWLRISQFQEETVDELAARSRNCMPRTRTSRAWCWTCATIRAACCPARSGCRPPSCRRTR
jgi:carboxyl-terminal processing protease